MHLKNRKILLFDGTNLAKRTAFSGHVKLSETEIDYQVFNFSLGNSIYTACIKHKPTSVVLASDHNSWRKIVYAPYKLNRRLDAQKKNESGEPGIDGEEFFSNLNKFSYVLRKNLPLIYLNEKQCEADDIIGILAKEYNADNELIIISGDQDYKQCLKHDNVKLGNPGGYHVNPGFVKPDCGADDGINVMALHGQNKDNIYNVFTPLDFPIEYNIMRESVEIDPIRKPSLPEKKAGDIVRSGKLEEGLVTHGPEEARKKNKQIEKENIQREKEGKQPKVLYEENIVDRFKINKKIISFDEIPQVLTNRVLQQIEDYELPKDTDFYTFFKKMRGNKPIDEFERTEKVLFNLY